MKKELLNAKKISIIIDRLCKELIENHDNFNNTVFVGVQPRGTLLSNRIIQKINSFSNISNIQNGNIDISFYRDDLGRRKTPIIPQVMDMNLSIESKKVILVDDVLYTGRSIRSAIDALMSFGRPKCVELLTLINRRFSRHLPIQPNYIGKTIDSLDSERVIVEWKEVHKHDRILIVKSNKNE